MNYLGHAYFSFGQPMLLVGNLISDFVKGKAQYAYPAAVQEGIRLHRFMDDFTDNHPSIREARQIFRPAYRLYAGAFADVALDYFIANDPVFFPEEKVLQDFAEWVYAQLRQYEQFVPEKAKGYFSRMQQQNWLFHYRSFWGIDKSFGGLVYRSTYLTDSTAASATFRSHIPWLTPLYQAFVTDLQQALWASSFAPQ